MSVLQAEDAPQGTWYMRKTEEDGVFVKVNDARAMNQAKHLMEEVVNVRPGKSAGKVEVR